MTSFLSIIVPTYQRADRLELLLNWLFQQRVDRSTSELIVVDDGSTDSTWDVLTRRAAQDSWLRPLRQDNQGQAVARQKGVDASLGQILLFLDDDMEPTSLDFLEIHRLFHVQTNLKSVAFGAILPPLSLAKRPAFEYFYELSIRKMYEGFTSGKIQPAGQHFYSANVSLSRKLFLAVGGFSSQYRHAEDRELGLRIEQKSDARFHFLEAASAFHHSQTGRFRSFIKRAQLYGEYEFKMSLVYPERFDLHPRMVLRSPNSIKRLLAHATWWLPSLPLLLNGPLVLLAKAFNGIGLLKLATLLCSAIYTLNYVRGYWLENAVKRPEEKDKAYAA